MYPKLGDIIGFVVALCVVILNAQNNVVSLTMAQKQAILDKHNQYRKECANGGHGLLLYCVLLMWIYY